MKALRTIGILVLVAGLMLGSVGTVFAGKPTDVPRGKRHGFAGNVTAVDITDGNVTITLTKEGSSVPVRLVEETRYKIPTVMNKWGNLTEFKDEGQLEGNLTALVNRRVVALAGNVTGTWVALKLLLLPLQGRPALHAHRTGLVSKFSYEPSLDGGGNITIIDIHGGNHTFVVGNNTVYHPARTGAGNITADVNLVNSSFVTVVIKGNPKLKTAEAKAIVVHPRIPEDWSITP